MRTLMVCLGLALAFVAWPADAPEPAWAGPVYEYASVRWMGDKTSILWPDGTFQKVVAFTVRRRPDGMDERMWYLTGAMNVMGRKGFELVHMSNEDVVMRRTAFKPKE